MDYNKPFNFLKSLPLKLNLFYKKKSKSGLIVSNKSQSKKDFDPVTNLIKLLKNILDYLLIKNFLKTLL